MFFLLTTFCFFVDCNNLEKLKNQSQVYESWSPINLQISNITVNCGDVVYGVQPDLHGSSLLSSYVGDYTRAKIELRCIGSMKDNDGTVRIELVPDTGYAIACSV